MPSPSVTYTFSNSTTADATQVNTNFTDLINGVTDGTRDLAINSLTCASTVVINGNTTIGNASSDTLVVAAGATFSSTAAISGAVTMASTLAVTGAATITGAATLQSTLAVTGAATLSSTLAVTGAATLSSTLAVTGAVTFSSTLAVTGTTTLNGNVTLGDASGDVITVTGSLGSSVAVGTTFAYDLGGSSAGFRSLYLGSNDSAAKTVRLIAPAVSASYSVTLPTATASQTGMTLISDTSSTWSYRYAEKTVAKTTTYTATGDETTILCDTSGGAWTLTLPAAASFTGKHFYIKKTSATHVTSFLTVDANGSETIDGALTTTVNSQYETIKIVSDGSNWHILERTYPSVWTSYTPTVANLGTGSTTINTGVWRRVGDSIEVVIDFLKDASAGSGGSTVTWTLPLSLTIDTTKLAYWDAIVGSTDFIGSGRWNSTSNGVMAPVIWSGTTVALFDVMGSSALIAGGNILGLDSFLFRFVVPISNWK